MTIEEFTKWLDDFRAAFPGTSEWVEKLPAKKATMRHWFEDCFVNVEFVDAWQVTRQMVKGDYPPIAAFDREKIPQIVSAYSDLACKRRLRGPAREIVPEYMEFKKDKGHFDLKGICSKIKSAISGGLTPQEACDKHLPAADQDDATRYRCLYCNDTGFANVWHVTAMHAAKHGKFDIRRHTSRCAIRCCCKAGNKYPGFEQVFNPEKWLHCPNYTRQEEIDRLHEFMGSYGVKVCDYDQFRPENYNDGF